ncbi:unnamed protein product, partial [Ectocarpus sp. 13 AM-2016]
MPSHIVRPHMRQLQLLPVFSATGTNRIVGLSGGLLSIAKWTPAPPTHPQKPLLLLATLVSAPTTTTNAHAAPSTSGSALAEICDDCAAPPSSGEPPNRKAQRCPPYIWRRA